MARQNQGRDLRFTFTRQPPPGWTGYNRRIDQAMLTEVVGLFAMPPQCFICGPTRLVEMVANTLVEIGLPSDTIRTERFGPS